jgi:murein DD-endopeptidase MepM/ murein hydrolase activator NlpD
LLLWLVLFKIYRVRTRLFAFGLALTVLAVPAASSWAASPKAKRTTKTTTAKDTRVAELRDLMGEASQQEAGLLQQIADIRERLDDLSATVKRYDREAAAARGRLAKAQRSLDRVEAQRAELVVRLARAESEVEQARLAVNGTVNALYTRGQSQEQAVYAAVVQGSTSPRDVFAAAHYLSGMLREDRALLDRFVDLKNQVAAMTREVAAQAEEAKVARDQLVGERDQIEVLRREAVAARLAAKDQEGQERDLLQEVQDRKADFQRELSLLQAESSAIGEMLRSLQAGQKLAPRRKGTFKAPVNGPISSRFGPRVHPILGDVRIHTGLDYAVGAGEPIRAAGAGIVVWVGPRGGYGNLVAIDHGGGLATLYAHQSRIDTTVGLRVKTGQVIGYVGSTGMATGPHLHFETREFGTPADPLFYL